MRRDLQGRADVLEVRLAQHRQAQDAELEHRLERGEVLGGALAAGQRIGDEADRMAARHLLAGQVDDVPEQAAERGPQHVQDAQSLRCLGLETIRS